MDGYLPNDHQFYNNSTGTKMHGIYNTVQHNTIQYNTILSCETFFILNLLSQISVVRSIFLKFGKLAVGIQV